MIFWQLYLFQQQNCFDLIATEIVIRNKKIYKIFYLFKLGQIVVKQLIFAHMFRHHSSQCTYASSPTQKSYMPEISNMYQWLSQIIPKNYVHRCHHFNICSYITFHLFTPTYELLREQKNRHTQKHQNVKYSKLHLISEMYFIWLNHTLNRISTTVNTDILEKLI